jgi:hypothetical protein
MIAVMFEVVLDREAGDRYFDLAAALKDELETVDGFLSVERFQSLTTEDKARRSRPGTGARTTGPPRAKAESRCSGTTASGSPRSSATTTWPPGGPRRSPDQAWPARVSFRNSTVRRQASNAESLW